MSLRWLFSLASLLPLISAQKVHIIKAGAGGFKFSPQQLTNIPVGDIVSFEFYPPDHSVARAEYGSACVPYELSNRHQAGFWSGTQYVDSVAEVTHYNVTINSTEPIFFYCAAKGSCTQELMVGAINPNAEQTLAGQIEAAKMAKFQVAPGEPMPKEGGGTPTESALPTSSAVVQPGHRLSTTVIIGIAVGIVLFIVLCGALFFFVGRSRSLKEVVRRHDEGATMKPVGVGGGYTELGYSPQHRQSTCPQPPQTPQGEYPQGFGSPLPPYASPHMSMSAGTGLQYYNDQKAAQPVIAELHSPTLGRQEFAAELEAPYVAPQKEKK